MTDPPPVVEQDAAAVSWCDACGTRNRDTVDLRDVTTGKVLATLTGCRHCQSGIHHLPPDRSS